MATVKFEAVAIVGKRKDDKPNYVRVGTVFETAKGLSLKLDSIPAGGEWNGWISLFEPKPREGSAPPRQAAPKPDFDDDIGF